MTDVCGFPSCDVSTRLQLCTTGLEVLCSKTRLSPELLALPSVIISSSLLCTHIISSFNSSTQGRRDASKASVGFDRFIKLLSKQIGVYEP